MVLNDELGEILLGGQSFSWHKESDGYKAVLNEKLYTINSLKECYKDEFLYSYFDLDFDYNEARTILASKDEYLKDAIVQFPDLRILKQDPFITTMSFILSQNNNIKRIKGLYDAFCLNFGHKVEGYYSFPTSQELKNVKIEDLKALKVGFRDRYLLDAIEKADILEEIKGLSYDKAETQLMKIKGIGKKVASCILLFAYQKREAFPRDVWINKVMSTLYPDKDESYFNPYPALAQQYLFSYARLKGI